jgi:hypothetical protein
LVLHFLNVITTSEDAHLVDERSHLDAAHQSADKVYGSHARKAKKTGLAGCTAGISERVRERERETREALGSKAACILPKTRSHILR